METGVEIERKEKRNRKIIPKIVWDGEKTIYYINNLKIREEIDIEREWIDYFVLRTNDRYLKAVRKIFPNACFSGVRAEYIHIPEVNEKLKYVARTISPYMEEHIYEDPYKFFNELVRICERHSLYYDDYSIVLLINNQTILLLKKCESVYGQPGVLVLKYPYDMHTSIINMLHVSHMLNRLKNMDDRDFRRKIKLLNKLVRYYLVQLALFSQLGLQVGMFLDTYLERR